MIHAPHSVPTPSLAKEPGIEALRGFATLAILAWHLLLAFAPGLATPHGLVGRPWLGLVHGTGAVGLLFLISGYVLAKRYFETERTAYLLETALKRWLRFIPLVCLSVLFSFAFYAIQAYRFKDAALLSHSVWLFENGGVKDLPTALSFGDALRQGLYGCFFLDESTFNSNLWSFGVEMKGSFLALGAAAMLGKIRARADLIVLFTGVCACAAYAVSPRLIAFLIGPLLALLAPAFQGLRLRTALPLLGLGLLCLGFRLATGFYGFLSFLNRGDPENAIVLTATLGGTLCLIAVTGSDQLRRWLNHPAIYFLGFISFPVYLFQILIIGSVGSWFFALFSGDGTALALALASVLVCLFSLSVPAAFFDRWWQRWLSKKTKALCAHAAE